ANVLLAAESWLLGAGPDEIYPTYFKLVPSVRSARAHCHRGPDSAVRRRFRRTSAVGLAPWTCRKSPARSAACARPQCIRTAPATFVARRSDHGLAGIGPKGSLLPARPRVGMAHEDHRGRAPG